MSEMIGNHTYAYFVSDWIRTCRRKYHLKNGVNEKPWPYNKTTSWNYGKWAVMSEFSFSATTTWTWARNLRSKNNHVNTSWASSRCDYHRRIEYSYSGQTRRCVVFLWWGEERQQLLVFLRDFRISTNTILQSLNNRPARFGISPVFNSFCCCPPSDPQLHVELRQVAAVEPRV